MSARWKPGDLCSMTWDGNMDGRFPVIRGAGRWYMTDYLDCTSEFLTDEWLEKLTAVDIRRLVVIDPESREQRERLMEAMRSRIESVLRVSVDDAALARLSDHLHSALREFANPQPPKPDEPTGLGAVVEDANGDRWVSRGVSYMWPWCLAHPSGIGGSKSWSDIKAVKVLSEGVTE